MRSGLFDHYSRGHLARLFDYDDRFGASFLYHDNRAARRARFLDDDHLRFNDRAWPLDNNYLRLNRASLLNNDDWRRRGRAGRFDDDDWRRRNNRPWRLHNDRPGSRGSINDRTTTGGDHNATSTQHEECQNLYQNEALFHKSRGGDAARRVPRVPEHGHFRELV